MRVLQIEDDVLTAAAVETILRSEGVPGEFLLYLQIALMS